jgi:hypothetical protein
MFAGDKIAVMAERVSKALDGFMSALANFVFTLLPRGSYLIGPFNASGKNRPLDALAEP